MRVRLVGLVLAGAVISGCGEGVPVVPRAETPLPPGASAAAVRAHPVELVGLWRLSVTGERQDAVLRLDGEGQLGLYQRCVSLTGEWRADTEGQFLGSLNGFSVNARVRECALTEMPPPASEPTPRWLRRVTGFSTDGAERHLLDGNGATVARLLPGASAAPRSELPPDLTGVPTVTAETRERLGVVAAPLPAGLTPVTDETMLGRWRPEGKDEGAYAEFKAGGAWEGSDGCNGQGGRWTAGTDGAFLATSGPSTLIGCANVPISGWVTEAGRAGLDGRTLVLLDSGGKELARLIRP